MQAQNSAPCSTAHIEAKGCSSTSQRSCGHQSEKRLMQSIMRLGAGSKEEVCSLQAVTEPRIGKRGREEPSTPCRTCVL